MSKNEKKLAPSFADLFFHAVDIQYGADNSISFFKGKCILCGAVIKPFGNDNTKTGRNKWQRLPFLEHLRTKHKGDHKQLGVTFESMTDLQLTMDRKRPAMQREIGSFFQSKRVPMETVTVVEPEDWLPDIETSEDQGPVSAFCYPQYVGIGSGYIHIDAEKVAKTMRVLESSISLSWDRRSKAADLWWDNEIATYDQSKATIPIIYSNTKILLKSLIPHFTSYSFSCDCWSSMSLKFKVICYFLHVYHNQEFRTFLLDAVPIEKGDAQCIRGSYKSVCEYYGLKEEAFITTDNASSNVNCFGDLQNACKAHSINTACSHLVSKTVKDSSVLALSVEERQCVRDYFSVAESTCGAFRGSLQSLIAWYAENKAQNMDINVETITKPPKACETRWLGKICNLEWLQKYGVLVYRYLLATGSKGISIRNLYSCLSQLPDVLGVLNTLNNALNLLTPDKCTAHLVLPIFSSLKELLVDAQSKVVNSIPALIIKSVLFELEKGCLTIRDTQRRVYCIAAACNPFLQEIAPSLRDECMNAAEEEYGRILQSLGEERLRTLTRSRESFARYMTSVVDDIPRQEIPSKASLLDALKSRELGMQGLLLVGELGDSLTHSLRTLAGRSEKSIDKEISTLRKAISTRKRRGKSFEEENERLVLLEQWKLYGGSSDATPASSGTSEEQRRKTRLFLSSLVASKKEEELHCLVNKERPCRSKPTDPVTILKESVLHLSATEADCERFFRILSQVAKKPYLVEIGPKKACMIAFEKYYSTEIYYSMGCEARDKYDIYSIFYEGI